MALQDQIQTYIDAATPQNDVHLRAQLASNLLHSGECYLSSDNVLCIRACSAAMANIRTSKLPTRISSDANDVLTALRELVNVGLLTGSGLRLHDQDGGVTVQVIP
jgi:hypothetical protein